MGKPRSARKNINPANCACEAQTHCLAIKELANKFHNLYRCPIVAVK